MRETLTLSSSLEDYLEAIYHLVNENRVARSKDIAARLHVHMSSVTGALRSLSAKSLVNYSPHSFITLTAKGRKAAREVVYKHNVLTVFLSTMLGLDEETSARNACAMEHVIEPVVLDRLMKFLDFMDRRPSGAKRIKEFVAFCEKADKAKKKKEAS